MLITVPGCFYSLQICVLRTHELLGVELVPIFFFVQKLNLFSNVFASDHVAKSVI